MRQPFSTVASSRARPTVSKLSLVAGPKAQSWCHSTALAALRLLQVQFPGPKTYWPAEDIFEAIKDSLGRLGAGVRGVLAFRRFDTSQFRFAGATTEIEHGVAAAYGCGLFGHQLSDLA